MRWLVDGMNVIGARPDRWWEDRDEAVRSLIERLAAFHAETGDEVTVVFDHRPEDLSEGPPRGVEVAFAPGRRRGAADDEIVRRVEADPDPSNLWVVTSDRGLAARVQALGGRVAPAGGFRRRLEETDG